MNNLNPNPAETVAEIVGRLGISAESVKVPENPNAGGGEWANGASHWHVTLRKALRPSYAITTYYSMGAAHQGKPTATQVLESLGMDATGYDNAESFEDWCAEYGDNPDSRKAYATWQAVAENTRRLRLFMGTDYAALLEAAQES